MESSTCLFEPITFASFLDQSKCRIVLLFFIGEGNDVCLCVCVWSSPQGMAFAPVAAVFVVMDGLESIASSPVVAT